MKIIDDVLVHYLLIKKKEEPLNEYVTKLKTTKEVAKSHIGGLIILTKCMKILEDYDLSNYKTNHGKSFARILSFQRMQIIQNTAQY